MIALIVLNAGKGATSSAGSTIYTGDGTLSSNRTVGLNGKTLTISGSNVSMVFNDTAQTIAVVAPNGLIFNGTSLPSGTIDKSFFDGGGSFVVTSGLITSIIP